MVKRLTKAVPWHTLKKDCSVLDEVPCNTFKQTAINVVYEKDSKNPGTYILANQLVTSIKEVIA